MIYIYFEWLYIIMNDSVSLNVPENDWTEGYRGTTITIPEHSPPVEPISLCSSCSNFATNFLAYATIVNNSSVLYS